MIFIGGRFGELLIINTFKIMKYYVNKEVQNKWNILREHKVMKAKQLQLIDDFCPFETELL